MYQDYRYNRGYPDIPGHATNIPRHSSGIPAKIFFVQVNASGLLIHPDIPPTSPEIAPAYPP
jgi:hypothetical protein